MSYVLVLLELLSAASHVPQFSGDDDDNDDDRAVKNVSSVGPPPSAGMVCLDIIAQFSDHCIQLIA